MKQRKHIYLAHHEGWYSVSDETFYPEAAVRRCLDPSTGRSFMVCYSPFILPPLLKGHKASVETGKEVEWSFEENYKFRLSDFTERLLQWYEQNPDWIIPKTRMSEIVKEVQRGLPDLSISRPSSRLKWGIKVPQDESQTIYVWLDALMNYVVKAGYPWGPANSENDGWPADLQVIGKDIIRYCSANSTVVEGCS